MKRLLLFFCFLLFASNIFAQQFLQYNTGTLYDSFENPAQRSFIPDSSRQYASNFFFPNFDGNISLTGNAQQTAKQRYFNNQYNNKNLQIGNGNAFNYVNANANAYLLMLKMFTNMNGKSEVGFFIESNALGRGIFTDETVALLNGSTNFPGSVYNNLFNSKFSYQAFNQIGFSYREQVTKQFAIGFKLASVSGMSYENINIKQSNVTFDSETGAAHIVLRGTNQKAGFSTLPFSNPGLAVSIGTLYRTQDGFVIQGNIKNLGFIHWNKNAETYNFRVDTVVHDLTSSAREDDIYHAIKTGFTKGGKTLQSFTTAIDGAAELSVNKSFWLDDERTFRYSPTLIASKELAYNGFTAAMVNPVTYNNYTLSLVTSYDDMHLLNFGGQFMIKSANAEFFIGSDRLSQSLTLVRAKLKSQHAINSTGSMTGGDITVGFSLKFGDVIEHPMNASHIPMGDDGKGFLGRTWDKIFHPNAGTIQNN